MQLKKRMQQAWISPRNQKAFPALLLEEGCPFFFLGYLHHAAAISGDYNEVSVEAGQEASALA